MTKVGKSLEIPLNANLLYTVLLLIIGQSFHLLIQPNLFIHLKYLYRYLIFTIYNKAVYEENWHIWIESINDFFTKFFFISQMCNNYFNFLVTLSDPVHM